jgi:hypothetical protein
MLLATSRRWHVAFLTLVGLLLAGVLRAAPPASHRTLPPAAPKHVDFARDVKPILTASCVSCHGQTKQKGDLRLDVKASVLGSGVIVPGKSADSPMIQRVAGLDPDQRMPPKGPLLSAEQIGVLRAWIDQGAVWTDATTGPVRSNHWAYQPLARPAVPTVKEAAWVRTPVDAFILARLEAHGMTPAEPADRRTLLRRVTFDLTGLPPTPAEIDAFLADAAPDAYEKVVDRLLASPAYGERWARHWMDIIHYAETHGNDQDVPRENAWHYRDYLIRSFNADKPYARFVQEQVAGDVLFPENADGIIATGMIAAGPWDESSQQSIRDDTVDKKVAQYLDRDDMVATVMGTFAAATVHCARCHNHKFDPISQAEYYGLQACFAGVDRANRPFDADPQVARTRQALLQRKAELQAGRDTLAAMLRTPAVQAEAQAWERSLGGRAEPWVLLEPVAVATAHGSTATTLPDRSVRFGGTRPEKDIYTVTLRTDLKGITCLRLEVLTDDSLPHKGPGRQDNGNLHLSEFRVTAAPKAKPADRRPVAIKSAVADFDQAGWTLAHALDGNPGTAWGIYPEVGKPHAAVFEFAQPIAFDGGAELTVTLEQLHGGGHLIGRLRLAATTAPRPLALRPLPSAITEILAIPPAQRTEAQRLDLALFVQRNQVEERLAALAPQQFVYAAASDFQPNGSFQPAKGCRPVYVLRRGNVTTPAEPAVPGGLACVPGLEARFKLDKPQDEGARRAVLARWLTDPANVLTWRAIVNRIWHYHFGRGIVATPNDLGKMGGMPTHPRLLDWLAVELRDGGGSLKRLHRLLVTSSVYRQSSRHNEAYAKLDGDNSHLWRMNRQRLDAESVRDAVLLVTGKIDRTMGGPSVKQFIQRPGIHVTPDVDYLRFDVDHPNQYRRSVYRFLFRTLPDPFMETLDCPDASQFMPVRSSSVTALQALAMLNDRFVVRQSEHFAARLGQVSADPAKQIEAAYLLALGRPPTPPESAALAAYATKFGLANACRVLLNSNEFMFVP